MEAAESGAVPDLAIPPGETLAEELRARAMTQRGLAELMHRSPRTVSDIVRGGRVITAEVAIELEEALDGPSARFWLNLQADYDLPVAWKRRRAGCRASAP